MQNLHTMKSVDYKTKAIRWGIIGCGDVTEKKSGPAFNLVNDSALVAVMRRDAVKAADYAKRHEVPFWFDDANELINHPDVNAIYIATPPKYHEEYVAAAVNAGKPVYVEKPMSVDVASCKRMQDTADKAGVKLCIAHYRRAMPKFIQIKELLDNKVIGDIRTVNITLMKVASGAAVNNSWRVDPEIAGAGLFYDLAPHQLDLVSWFFGDAIHVAGFASNQGHLYKAEDTVTGTMQFKNDVLFTGTWCFSVCKSAEKDVFEITGTKGMISFPVFGHELSITTEGETEVINYDPMPHIQQPMIEKVVQFFTGKAENPCTAAAAIKSMQMMESFAYGNRNK